MDRNAIIHTIGNAVPHLTPYLFKVLQERREGDDAFLVFLDKGAPDQRREAALTGLDAQGAALRRALFMFVGSDPDVLRTTLVHPCLQHLQKLGIGVLPESTIAGLDALPASVTSLRILQKFTDERVTQLANMPAMKQISRLHLQGNKLTDAGLATIAEHLVQLTELNLGLQFASRSAKQGWVRKGGKGITAIGLKALASAPLAGQLEILGLSLSNTGAGASVLCDGAFTVLAKLDLSRSNVSTKVMSLLFSGQGLPRLHTLNVADTRFGAKQLQALHSADGLLDVDLSGTKLNDAGLAAATGSHSWQRLALRGLGLRGGLAVLPTLTPALQYLDLTTAISSRDGLPALANLAQLQELVLTQTRVGDGALDTLRSDSLETIWLNWTRVTREGIQRLTERCPRLTKVAFGQGHPGYSEFEMITVR